jgi:site-specific DNA-methyltransferase (adenine-specific)
MNLFDTRAFEPPTTNNEGSYFPTPTWAAQEIITQRVPLPPDAFVLEPTCGDGRFLDALPPGTRRLGVEIRADLAAIAAVKGHHVIQGDILTVPLPEGITHAVGNPPFSADFIDALLNRLHGTLTKDGIAAFILPCYLFQTSRRVWDYTRKWSIDVEMIPRDIYEGLSKPLALARFQKSTSRRLVGLFLYPETVDIVETSKRMQDRLERMTWRDVVFETLADLGGRATLKQLYRAIEPKRPSGNPWWRERIRATLQGHARNIERGTWALPLAA